MLNKINLLYVGTTDFEKLYSYPDYVIPVNFDPFDDLTSKDRVSLFDIVILDRKISEYEVQYLKKATKGHCLFATENVDMEDPFTSLFFEGKMGKFMYTGDVNTFLKEDSAKYFGYSYGEKFKPCNLAISKFFKGKITNDGSYNMQLEGDFGDDFTQIAYWRYNIPVEAEQLIDLYLEYKKHGTVEIKLRVIEFYSGSVFDIRRTWLFDEKDLQSVVTIGGEPEYGLVFVSVLARGKGKLNIISLHDRHSRANEGYFIPGGDRQVTPNGEEIFSYFEKGDLKPPLIVYFSGYRTQEGFEGYYMMRSYGCQFLLFTDPRQEGGAFYVGDAEYERMITATIKEKMRELGFTKKDVILSGASMGTYGALYYGSRIMPHALILAKPLVNMGNIAKNERIVRTEGFGTSIDQLKKNYHSLDEDAIDKFNRRIWKEFDEADWSETKFIISYLYEDDYDPDGYRSILKHLKSGGVQVYGKGNHGRHVDNSAAVMEWFKSRYSRILKEDFDR